MGPLGCHGKGRGGRHERGSPLPYLVGLEEGLQTIQLLGILPRSQNTVAQNTVQRGEARRAIDEAPFRTASGHPELGGVARLAVLSSRALGWEHKCRKVLRHLSLVLEKVTSVGWVGLQFE